MYYSIEEINSHINSNALTSHILSNETNYVLFYLIDEINKYATVDERVLKKHGEHGETRPRYAKKSSHSNNVSGNPSKNELMDEKWEKPVFKATVMETKEGIEKQINEIRILLNKITDKNYETQKNAIVAKIKECYVDDAVSEDLKKVVNVLFDIAKSNKFYSEIYAKLYKELIQTFSIFNDTIEPFIHQFMESLNKLVYVDSNVDYDGYCTYTKINDNRRASITFLVNLLKNDITLPVDILDIVEHFQDLALKYIEEPNRVNEVDEITEVLFIAICMIHSMYRDSTKWQTAILVKINTLASYKINEKPSLSSRTIFKYKDIVDKIK